MNSAAVFAVAQLKHLPGSEVPFAVSVVRKGVAYSDLQRDVGSLPWQTAPFGGPGLVELAVAPVAKATSSLAIKPGAPRSKPVEIDAQTLRHVAGGTTDGPKKYW